MSFFLSPLLLFTIISYTSSKVVEIFANVFLDSWLYIIGLQLEEGLLLPKLRE